MSTHFTLVLVAQAVFLSERGQTDRQTRLKAVPHSGGYTYSRSGVLKHIQLAFLLRKTGKLTTKKTENKKKTI